MPSLILAISSAFIRNPLFIAIVTQPIGLKSISPRVIASQHIVLTSINLTPMILSSYPNLNQHKKLTSEGMRRENRLEGLVKARQSECRKGQTEQTTFEFAPSCGGKRCLFERTDRTKYGSQSTH